MPLEHEPHGPLRKKSSDPCSGRDPSRPRLLPSTAPSQPRRAADDGVQRQARSTGDVELRPRGGLRRREHVELGGGSGLPREDERRVGLEVKVLLAADADRALDDGDLAAAAASGSGRRRGGFLFFSPVSLEELVDVPFAVLDLAVHALEEGARGDRVLDRQDRLLPAVAGERRGRADVAAAAFVVVIVRVIRDFDQQRRPPRQRLAPGHDDPEGQAHGLASVPDRQEEMVPEERAPAVLAGDVGGAEEEDRGGGGGRGGARGGGDGLARVDGGDPRRGPRREHQGPVERPGR